ncbi:hypothetical protein FHR81_003769 [Actinoalloteichus hoggarensis]|uniref:Uncharacterized protein n=1 Tax=Actinoalloteichus hoggarensis TaxID=1470176 RepID=A0A221WCW1_9PSEU|nr:hypothetical protein [Actinoalloteichus hoggarensis]ASO23107.1 hypothetical protein AHOG_27550 [Actinoalloteichus hoggarensis]MBB5922712.1 hypothetical protein [Actinoalloteichus hoggarensis]
MKINKLVPLLLIALGAYAVLVDPDWASGLVLCLLSWLRTAAESIATFLHGLGR